MSRWDRITLVDRDIMKVLKKDKDFIGLKYYEIAKKTGRNPKLIYYHMPKLEKMNFVERIENNPALWILKTNAHNNIAFVEVECPKCKGHQFAYLHQHTLTCKNEFCLTSKHRRTRFSITPKRIVGTPIYLNQSEDENIVDNSNLENEEDRESNKHLTKEQNKNFIDDMYSKIKCDIKFKLF